MPLPGARQNVPPAETWSRFPWPSRQRPNCRLRALSNRALCNRAQALSRPEPEPETDDDVPPFAKRPGRSLFSDDDDNLDSAPPLAKPVARPAFERHEDDESPPLARPVARPAFTERPAQAEPAAVNFWVDPLLAQTSTPWLPGDEARFQKGVAAPREGLSGLAVGMVSVAVLAALATAAWLWMGR